jgi:putative SOS response-associated peptidase YedK
MCGRFTLRTPASVLIAQFRVAEIPDLAPRYNIAPTQLAPVVRLDGSSGQRQWAELRWGLIPSWAKDPSIGNRLINARSETVVTKPAFRAAFRQRRCLVVADGYYEWKKQGRQKQPFYIHVGDGQPMAMAGLWERWQPDGSEGGQPRETFTIITKPAHELTRAGPAGRRGLWRMA